MNRINMMALLVAMSLGQLALSQDASVLRFSPSLQQGEKIDSVTAIEDVTRELELVQKALDESPMELSMRYNAAQIALARQITESIQSSDDQLRHISKLRELKAEMNSLEKALENEKQLMNEYLLKLDNIKWQFRLGYIFSWSIPIFTAFFLFFRILRNRFRRNRLIDFLQKRVLQKMGRAVPFKNDQSYSRARLIAWHLGELKAHLSYLGVNKDQFSPRRQEQFRNHSLLMLTSQAVGALDSIWGSWGITPIDPHESSLSAIGIKLKELEVVKSNHARQINARERELALRHSGIEKEISQRVESETILAVISFTENFRAEQKASIAAIESERDKLQATQKDLQARISLIESKSRLVAEREDDVKNRAIAVAESKRQAEELVAHNQLILEEISDQRVEIRESAQWQDEAAIRLNDAIRYAGDKFANLIFSERPLVIARILDEALSQLKTDVPVTEESA